MRKTVFDEQERLLCWEYYGCLVFPMAYSSLGCILPKAFGHSWIAAVSTFAATEEYHTILQAPSLFHSQIYGCCFTSFYYTNKIPRPASLYRSSRGGSGSEMEKLQDPLDWPTQSLDAGSPSLSTRACGGGTNPQVKRLTQAPEKGGKFIAMDELRHAECRHALFQTNDVVRIVSCPY